MPEHASARSRHRGLVIAAGALLLLLLVWAGVSVWPRDDTTAAVGSGSASTVVEPPRVETRERESRSSSNRTGKGARSSIKAAWRRVVMPRL